ncbi:MAG: hypothetical protein F4057_02810, partial [Acidobacteria bacterium]|nr:hypothetical protein [Acidobacteriota bacterium]
LSVTAKAGSAGHPDYFEVTRKDGSTATYGAKGASGAEDRVYVDPADETETGQVLTWAVREVKDSAGNKIVYTYTDAEDAHRVTAISYAYGDGTARAEARFTYGDRKDPSAGYLAGRTVQSTQRLLRVTMYSSPGTRPLKALYNYRLSYRAVADTAPDKVSRLDAVQGCVGSGATLCQPKTEFTWSEPDTLFKATGTTLTLNTEGKWTPVDFNPADFNGDGLTDLAWTETKGNKHRLRYALANKTTGQLSAARFVGGGTALEYDDDYGTSDYGNNLRVHTEVVDYNGDGRHDLLVYRAETDETRLHLSVPQAAGGWLLSAGAATNDRVLRGRYRYADLNADGLLDAYKLVVTGYSPHDSRVPVSYGLEVRLLKPAPGQPPSSSRYYAFAPAHTLAVPFTQLAPIAPPDGSPPDTPPSYYQWRTLEQADVPLADRDGDGRADLITWGDTWLRSFGVAVTARRLEVFRQADAGFARYGAADGIPVSAAYTPKGLRAQDLNGDGLSDLMYFTGLWYTKAKDNVQWTGNWH